MRKILLAVFILCAGCAAPNTIEYKSDASGRWVKTVYSKSFLSPKTDLADGLRVAITGYDEGKVNPVAAALGALGPESETPPASFVAHFLNTSKEPLEVEFLTLKVRNKEFALEPKKVTIQPDEIVSTTKVMGTFIIWNKEIETELSVQYRGEKITKSIVLKQETQDEFKSRMKRYRDGLKK